MCIADSPVEPASVEAEGEKGGMEGWDGRENGMWSPMDREGWREGGREGGKCEGKGVKIREGLREERDV